jgi:hypothetical protein
LHLQRGLLDGTPGETDIEPVREEVLDCIAGDFSLS